jgi:hypothetical protein
VRCTPVGRGRGDSSGPSCRAGYALGARDADGSGRRGWRRSGWHDPKGDPEQRGSGWRVTSAGRRWSSRRCTDIAPVVRADGAGKVREGGGRFGGRQREGGEADTWDHTGIGRG